MLRSLFQSKANAVSTKASKSVQMPSQKALAKYLFAFNLPVGIVSAYCFLNPDAILRFFIVFQCFAFLLGVIHVWLMGKKFGWTNKYSFLEKLEITFLGALIMFILCGTIIYFSPLKPFFYVVPLAVLGFTLPMLITSLFDFAVSVQPKEYKKWYYPERVEKPDVDKLDFSNSYILSLEIYKKIKDEVPSIMKFKAPLSNITFGEMFHMYLYEYNNEFRETQIEYMDSQQQVYGWLFYIKPRHWWKSKRIIDTSLSIRENRIAENDIIVPFRV